MIHYRLSKYDPAFRDAQGRYLRDEWIMASQVGHRFDGVALTEEAYRRVEDNYVAAVEAFLREAGVTALAVRGVENRGEVKLDFTDGTWLDVAGALTVVRDMLRERYWCRLESEHAFVHAGWDYYLYVGAPRACAGACDFARAKRLFVEPMKSPIRSPYGDRAAE
jgi:hypothetical protein